jgi:integrase
VAVCSCLPANGHEKGPKSGVVRSVLIDQATAALDWLSRRGYLTGKNDHVFVSDTGGPVDDTDMRDGFYTALEAAELEHLREQEDPIVFHDLRHCFGTLAVKVWPVTDVQAFMGHSAIATTMRYVHHVRKDDAAERFSRSLATRLCPRCVPNP